jgi:hypothetical protein
MSGIVRLGELAQVSLGYKSLQNDFFYLNRATISTYGIENRYLTPIVLFRDLDAASYQQKPKAATWLFHCADKEGDIRGTGALRYIHAMAARPAAKKKQSGKTTTIQEALEAQGGGLWYAPKATPHPARLWLRKACNSIYAPFVFVTASVVDQRCNYIEPKAGIPWELLAAVLTSTLFAFSLEINGSASMGAGALEAPTTKLRQYPVLDPRTLTAAEKQHVVKLVREVWKTETPIDWLANPKPGRKLEELDTWLLKRTCSGVTTATLYNDLSEACAGRIAVAQDKVRTTKKKQVDNLTNVAQGIADQVRPLLNARRFPENFLTDPGTAVPITVDRQAVRRIKLQSLLDQTTLTLSGDRGKPLLQETYNAAIAEALVRAILLGRESFPVPADRMAAATAVSEFLTWFDEIRLRLKAGIDESAFGTGYEGRLTTEVYQRLGIDPRAGERVLPPEMNLAPTEALTRAGRQRP